MFPTLLPAQIDRLREFGIVRTFATGETLAKVGEISQGFAITDGQDRGVIGTQTWRLADLGSKHMLLKEGIGWGYMPEPMVRTDIEKGRLVRLDMPEYKDGFIRLHAIYRTDTPPGPAGSWLIARFVAQAEEAAEANNQRTGAKDQHNCAVGTTRPAS
jgi:DNA-binding transcriptional LysR family regulator